MGQSKHAGDASIRRLRIGLDVGIFGRFVRLAIGVLTLTSIAIDPAFSYAAPGLLWLMLLTVLGAAIAYTLLLVILGERLFATFNPWVGTVLVLAPLGLRGLPVVPHPVALGLTVYVGGSLIVTSLMRYGGCEVVSIPSLVLRRRYVVYCPWNVVDAVERSASSGGRHPLRQASVLAALGLVAYAWVFAPAVHAIGLHLPQPGGWSLLLLVPAILLTWQAFVGRSDQGAGVDVLASLALVGLALVMAGLVPTNAAWAAIMVGGLLLAAGRWALRSTLRSPKETAV